MGLLEKKNFENLITYQCFRLASAIGHWPITSENGLFLVNGRARMAYQLQNPAQMANHFCGIPCHG